MKKFFSLASVDGNAFSVMGYVTDCMKKVGFTKKEQSEYTKEAMSSSYDNLLVISMEMIMECNDRLKFFDKEVDDEHIL